jgi:hypothetical protein
MELMLFWQATQTIPRCPIWPCSVWAAIGIGAVIVAAGVGYLVGAKTGKSSQN